MIREYPQIIFWNFLKLKVGECMRILVTGGLGYLGSVLTTELLKKGFSVSIIDSNLYGNFLSEEVKEKVKIFENDIMNSKIKEAIKDSDVIVHLAAIVGDQTCDLIKQHAVDINLNGTKNILKLCNKYNKKLIYASTCSVYGASNRILKEGSKTLPLSIYALTKLGSENVIERYGKNFTIFRFATLFGYSPRMRFDLVVNTFIGNAINNKEITVFGGNQWRPFLHVKDASDAIITTIEKNYFDNEILNLASINLRIIDVANIIKKKLGCKLKIMKEIKDPRNYRVDFSKAKKELGFSPKRNIDTAIKEIVDAFKNGKISDTSLPIYSNYESLKNVKDKLR
jgi:nucleoside-diphosphate-sugar epimerase